MEGSAIYILLPPPQNPIAALANEMSGTSRTIELTVVLAIALTALSLFHPERSTAVPSLREPWAQRGMALRRAPPKPAHPLASFAFEPEAAVPVASRKHNFIIANPDVLNLG